MTTQHNNNMHDSKIGAISGFVGGFAKYISTIHLHEEFPVQLIEASITAVICSVLGLLVKEVISFIKKKLNKNK